KKETNHNHSETIPLVPKQFNIKPVKCEQNECAVFAQRERYHTTKTSGFQIVLFPDGPHGHDQVNRRARRTKKVDRGQRAPSPDPLRLQNVVHLL
ncbi:MAG: hypothetical protein SVX38_13015, partial [Chloroflexota bacterium]|nr:hypothetical protein [Chloroflexota bacterium]